MNKTFTTMNEVVEMKKGGTEKLGEGSFSKVKLVSHRDNLNQLYAMKTIIKKNEKERKLIYKEIKLHQTLDHPNVIKFVDYIEGKTEIYIFLEYAKNGDLFHQITRNKHTNEELLKFFFQTCQAIKYIHGKNIMHRDLKPENILLDDKMNVKICDFGWSTEYFENVPRETLCGTCEYMAPEVILRKRQTKKTDIWALGILLYELFHGNAPFRGNRMEVILEKITQNNFLFKKNIDPDIKDIVIQMLKFNPEERPNILQILDHAVLKKMTMNGLEIEPQLTKEEFANQFSTSNFFAEIHSPTPLNFFKKIDKFLEETLNYVAPKPPYLSPTTSTKNFFDLPYDRSDQNSLLSSFKKIPIPSNSKMQVESQRQGEATPGQKPMQIDAKIDLSNPKYLKSFSQASQEQLIQKSPSSSNVNNKNLIFKKDQDTNQFNPNGQLSKPTIYASLRNLTPSLQNFQIKQITTTSNNSLSPSPLVRVNSTFISNYQTESQPSKPKNMIFPKSSEQLPSKITPGSNRLIQCCSFEAYSKNLNPSEIPLKMTRNQSKSEFLYKPMSFVNHQIQSNNWQSSHRYIPQAFGIGEKSFGNYQNYGTNHN